ncbi:MAG TPA: hypothetical protein VNM91_11570 [Dehalococcoidia bacterium]|nr:hypothetical protein [Dehalococcoidia bacterium]
MKPGGHDDQHGVHGAAGVDHPSAQAGMTGGTAAVVAVALGGASASVAR